MKRCNWTSGKRWSVALAYRCPKNASTVFLKRPNLSKLSLSCSITPGGFGADRFYLGHWEAGIGKLFSLGGLGIWTIVDVILIAAGYVGPADGSLYIT